MYYKFRIISNENKEFARELLIKSDNTFLDFHNCLQENLGYDPSQLASFFMTNSSWEKKLQITLIDMMNEESDNCITMDQAILADHMEDKDQRMLYVFDFFTERSFFMELTEILEISDKKTDPKVIFSHGDPPDQIDLGLDNISFSEDFDDKLSMESFDDELSEGFDYLDTDEFPDE